MAKIFSNIAKTAPNLVKRYDDSTVTNELTTFNALRNEGGANTLFISNTPKKVYDLYTDPATTSTLLQQTFTTSRLVEPESVVRLRRSKFYEAFRTANTNLTALNVPVNGTLIEIKPYSSANVDEIYSVDTSRMSRDSRSNPLVSGPRDVIRMQRYLNSSAGINFKAFQQILQAGNTFGQSQGYNPVSVETMVLNYRNATFYNPLERVSRILEGDAIINTELQGRLQKRTALDAQSKLRLKFVGGSSPQSQQSPLLGALNNLLSATLRDRVNNINIPVPGFARRLFGNSINVGQVSRQLDAIAAGAEAIRRGLNTNNSTLETDQTAYDSLYLNNLWPLMKENDGTVRNFQGRQGTRQQYLERARQAIRKGKDINNINKNTVEYPEDDYRSSATYTEDVRSAGTKTKEGLITATYIKDEMNFINQGTAGAVDAKQLDGLHEDTDYIKFRIVVPGVFDKGINFRAFIEDINHSSKGQYDEVRYVGRPERFITYKGMNRSMTVSIFLVAFSDQELATIWARANMLNKLTFPIDASGGFMTPPIARLTIGNVIVNQPGYIENVDMRLQDIPWDIDRELPQAIKLNFTYNIIEEGFVTQKATNPFAPGSQIFGERDVAQRTQQLFAGFEQTNQSINSALSNLNIPTPNIPNITTDLTFPRGSTTQTGASIAGYLDQRDLDAQRRAEVRFAEGAARIAAQQELDRQAVANNQRQGLSEDTDVGPIFP
jgi:hypothetical protein